MNRVTSFKFKIFVLVVDGRLDVAQSPSSPQNRHSATATATAADRCRSRDRTSSAGGTSSPARCPGVGKSIPASGKSSPAASLQADSRRRRAVDYRQSPRHATNDSVGGLGQSSACRHSVKSDGVQSASSSSAAVLDSRLKPTTSEEHSETQPASLAETLPAVHSVRHLAVPAGRTESQLRRRSDRHDGKTDDSNGNSRQPLTHLANNTASATDAADDDEDDDDDVDGVISGSQRCTQPSPVSTDTKSTLQVCCLTFDWLRGTAVERPSLAGELSLSCARPVVDG